MNTRTPLLSDADIQKIVDRWISTAKEHETETRLVEIAVCDPPYPASWVRDYYEHLIAEGKLRVVVEVGLMISEGQEYCGKCGHIVEDYDGDPYRFCPGCGNPIKR